MSVYGELSIPCRVQCRECDQGAHLLRESDLSMVYECDSREHTFPIQGYLGPVLGIPRPRPRFLGPVLYEFDGHDLRQLP